jgi:hypothetical protein
MKATAVRSNTEVIPIFKKPVTDSGSKFSRKGITAVYGDSGEYTCTEGQDPGALDNCSFLKIFCDGELLVDETFDTIRRRVREGF